MAGTVMCIDTPEALRHEVLPHDPEAWKDGLRTTTEPGAFEWRYFDTDFSDGPTAVIIFLAKSYLQCNYPLAPAVRLSITRPDGVMLYAFLPAKGKRILVSVGGRLALHMELSGGSMPPPALTYGACE